MKTVLIVSKTKQSITPLINLLEEEGYLSVHVAVTVKDAESMMLERLFDMIIINTPLEEESGISFAAAAVKNSVAGVILLAVKEALQTCEESLAQKGIIVVYKPINVAAFKQAIHVWESAKKRIESLHCENEELKTKVEELKIIHRAKCVLMECLSMSEPQAHRYLEKQAMDLRQSKLRAAQQVLRTYENF